MNQIKFGTDGWRAVIADTFTFDNLRTIAQALCDFLHSHLELEKGIAISFDTRFMSAQFARTLAEVISSNRIPVYLSDSFTPTPVLSYAVKHRELSAGIMVTASHNPYYYNGVKFKASYGGPVQDQFTREVEKLLNQNKPRHDSDLIKHLSHKTDFFDDYKTHVKQIIDFDAIASFDKKIVFDPMHGAGCGYFEKLLNETELEIEYINNNPDATFAGRLPEPTPKNLSELRKQVVNNKAVLALATDGDADRFGVIDEYGEFVQLHDLMPLLFSYLIEEKKLGGDVVRTTSMADTIDRLAEKHGRKVTEVPVGFKNVCEKMLKMDILIGGEESGGFGFKNHIPERDGIFSCLLLLEMLSVRDKSLSEMVESLRKEFGPFSYGRIDKYFNPEVMHKNLKTLRDTPPEKFGQFNMDRVSIIDGIKFYFSDNSWMLMRVSQTEPLGRIYVGSDNDQKISQLLQMGTDLLTK